MLGITANVKGFRTITPERLVAALRRVARPGTVNMKDISGFDPAFGLSVINPVFGDDVLPVHPLLALASGAGRDVDVLVGTTEDEANSWLAPTRLLGIPTWVARLILRRLVPQANDLIRVYRTQNPDLAGGPIFSRILSDLAFRWPARQYAAAHQGRTHFYEFDWDSPAARGRLGAAHGLDLGFVFDTLSTVTGPHGIAGTNPPQELADYIHHLWVQFATDGNVPWPEFTGTDRKVWRLYDRRLDTEQPLAASLFIPPVNQPSIADGAR